MGTTTHMGSVTLHRMWMGSNVTLAFMSKIIASSDKSC